ncbi:hypothetical protein TUM12370_01740 [Salmonella enterica subsp. enterica serovar Choleraesuis]|nr:hypothetical protein TUM12370_01740 [Salmonella enterica subsp. enterica serovar Choleraesuis]
MKKFALIISLITAGWASFQVSAAPLTGCAAKQANIENQLSYAEKYGNSFRVNGLRKALSEVREHCTNASLLAERQNRITEKERKVAERQAELNKVKASGRTDKIANKQKKLAEAEQELKEAQAELLK